MPDAAPAEPEKQHHWRCPVCGVTDQTDPADDGPLPMDKWHCFVCDELVPLEMGDAIDA